MEDAISLLRQQFETGHQWLRDTLADVTEAQAAWQPPGGANPLGATLAHVLIGEDSMIQRTVRGGTPLFGSSWSGRTGLSELPPGPGEGDWAPWARAVEVDLAALRAYGDAVEGELDGYLAKLDAGEFDRDVQARGLDGYSVGRFLATITLPHLIVHTGEIACLKGMQGARGYAE